MTLDDFWGLFKYDGLDCDRDELTGEDRYIDLERALWFMTGISVWKNHRNFFYEHILYVNNDIQNSYKIGILKYSERLRGFLIWLSNSLLQSGKMRSTMKPPGTSGTIHSNRNKFSRHSIMACLQLCRISSRERSMTIKKYPLDIGSIYYVTSSQETIGCAQIVKIRSPQPTTTTRRRLSSLDIQTPTAK